MAEDECTIEIKAENLYLKGAELERNNNYYDAIQFYRKAIQLVPDIDVKVFKKAKLKESNKFENKENYVDNENQELLGIDNDVYDGSEPLCDRFMRILGRLDILCTPEKPQNTLHISDLPTEVIIYILRWVVSDELDLRSLDQCSLISRGFYICARDSHIWKSACMRIWKDKQISLSGFDSWRDMYLNRPKVITNGCYISETKYYRQGEKSFQDQYFKPYHLVVYYRYFRFFADGTVTMINSAEIPAMIVGQLKNKNAKFGSSIRGSYKMIDDYVHVTFKIKRISRESMVINFGKNKLITLAYHMKFQLKKYKKWKYKLVWKEYRWSCSDDETYNQNFEIRDDIFPPLYFSRVKSYTAESEKPLL